MTKQVHLAVQFPPVDDTAVCSAARAGSHLDVSELARVARTAERGRFDFILLATQLPLRQQDGVVSRLDAVTALGALAGVTEQLGLAAAVSPTFQEPYELARQLATLDHLSGGRSAWHVLTSWDGPAAENFRRGDYLPQGLHHERAGAFVRTVGELIDSWHRDDVVADKASGIFLRHPRTGTFVHRDGHFDIAGRFNVPRSPQDRPVIIHAGDCEDDRELAASGADAVFSRHRTLPACRAFYADVKSRLAKYGRRRDELLILLELSEPLPFAGPAATVAATIDEFVQADACDGFLLVPQSATGLGGFVDHIVPLLQQRGVFRADYEGTTLREHLGLAAVEGRSMRAAS